MSDKQARENIVKQILTLPSFIEEENTLYEEVAVKNIKCNRNKNVNTGVFMEGNKVLDIVICRGETVKLSINFSKNGNSMSCSELKGIPHLSLLISDFISNECERLLTYIDTVVLSECKEKYTLSVVPIETIISKCCIKEKEIKNILLQEKFLQKQIITTNECMDNGKSQYMITEYGKECGLIKRRRMDKFHVLYQELILTQKMYEELDSILRWRSIEHKKAEKKIPFAKRIQNLKRGLPGDNDYSVTLVKKSADLPIELFFKEQSDKLKELKAIIEEFDKKMSFETYQETAYIIHTMLMDMDEKNKQKGRMAMMILASPFLNEIARRKGEKNTT